MHMHLLLGGALHLENSGRAVIPWNQTLSPGAAIFTGLWEAMTTDLNWDMKFAMEQAADDAELFQELLEIFKQACSDDLAAIKAGLDGGDAKRVYIAAHSMKGAAASLGMLTIKDLAMGMEMAARTGNLAVVRAGYENLATLVNHLQDL